MKLMKFAIPSRHSFASDDNFRADIAHAKAALHARFVKVAILAAAGIVLLIVVWPLAILWGAFFAWRGMQRAKKHGRAAATNTRRAIVQTTARKTK
jgi:hypothetical protein